MQILCKYLHKMPIQQKQKQGAKVIYYGGGGSSNQSAKVNGAPDDHDTPSSSSSPDTSLGPAAAAGGVVPGSPAPETVTAKESNNNTIYYNAHKDKDELGLTCSKSLTFTSAKGEPKIMGTNKDTEVGDQASETILVKDTSSCSSSPSDRPTAVVDSIPVPLSTSVHVVVPVFDTDSFAHPVKDAPAKCNLVDSIRTLFVDVIVTNAVSPLNFSIQSYKEHAKLQALEAHMTEFYKQLSKSTEPIKFEDLLLNGFYAVKYIPPNSPAKSTVTAAGESDKETGQWQWRRCQIMKPFIQSLPLLTYLVDHGCYFMTEPANVQLLKKMYCELPCQSLEAKLHFVDSKKVQFTPEDCHRFHQQVEGKAFCGIIMKPITRDSSTSSSSNSGGNGNINVVLIDTSGQRDHYIHHDYTSAKIRKNL